MTNEELKNHAHAIMNADTEYDAQELLTNVINQAQKEMREDLIKWEEEKVKFNDEMNDGNKHFFLLVGNYKTKNINITQIPDESDPKEFCNHYKRMARDMGILAGKVGITNYSVTAEELKIFLEKKGMQVQIKKYIIS